MMSGRSLEFGASTPEYLNKLNLGSGTSAASFSINSMGDSLIWVVPLLHGVFSSYSRSPFLVLDNLLCEKRRMRSSTSQRQSYALSMHLPRRLARDYGSGMFWIFFKQWIMLSWEVWSLYNKRLYVSFESFQFRTKQRYFAEDKRCQLLIEFLVKLDMFTLCLF